MGSQKERNRKVRHACHVLQQIHQYLGDHPSEHDVGIRCADGLARVNSIVLAAISPMLREVLLDNGGDDVTVIVAEESFQVADLETFFSHVFDCDSKNRNSDLEDVFRIRRVCETLGVNRSHLPSDIFAAQELEKIPKKQHKCLFCPKHFNNVSARNFHVTSKHRSLCRKSGTTVYRCAHCPDLFLSVSGRENHMQRIHGHPLPDEESEDEDGGGMSDDVQSNLPRSNFPIQLLPCLYCPTSFSGLPALRHHVRERHPQHLLACLMCGCEHDSAAELFDHIQQHARDLDNAFFPCKFCGTNFSVRYDLRMHMRREHLPLPKFKCDECSSAFYNARFLANHAIREHGAKGPPRKLLACDHCDKKFRYKALLDRHTRSHLGIKPYICEMCGKSFVDCTRLGEHQQLLHERTGHRRGVAAAAAPVRYGCQMCDLIFPVKSYFLRHVRSEEHRQKEANQAVAAIINTVTELEMN